MSNRVRGLGCAIAVEIVVGVLRLGVPFGFGFRMAGILGSEAAGMYGFSD